MLTGKAVLISHFYVTYTYHLRQNFTIISNEKSHALRTQIWELGDV